MAWQPRNPQAIGDRTWPAAAAEPIRRTKSGNSRTELVSVDIASGARTQYTASNEVKLAPQFLLTAKQRADAGDIQKKAIRPSKRSKVQSRGRGSSLDRNPPFQSQPQSRHR